VILGGCDCFPAIDKSDKTAAAATTVIDRSSFSFRSSFLDRRIDNASSRRESTFRGKLVRGLRLRNESEYLCSISSSRKIARSAVRAAANVLSVFHFRSRAWRFINKIPDILTPISYVRKAANIFLTRKTSMRRSTKTRHVALAGVKTAPYSREIALRSSRNVYLEQLQRFMRVSWWIISRLASRRTN